VRIRRSGRLLLVYDILWLIEDSGADGATISAIVMKANTTHDRAQRMLELLQERGFIHKCARSYCLTQGGRNAVAQMRKLYHLAEALGLA